MYLDRLFAPALLVATLAATAGAQQPAPSLPTPPASIAYRYWPRQFVQWVGPELPYSMVELDLDDRSPKPLYDAILTDRASHKRVHYTNDAAELALERATGAEAYLVPMQFDLPEAPANGATYTLRFATEKNVPVVWQFVQGSDMSEKGSGLTAIPGAAPELLYREQGAVAGEGTALKVGNIVSAAEVWKEISQPPYFVAYHGAISQDVHTIGFMPHAAAWTLDPATAQVAAGAEWQLTGARGQALAEHVDAVSGTSATLRVSDVARGTAVKLEAQQTATGWALTRATYGPAAEKGDHTITISFTPSAAAAPERFEVTAGRKTHLASGTVALSAAGKQSEEAWTFAKPDALSRATAEASVTGTH